MRFQITSIGILTAFKIGAIFSGLVFLVAVVPTILLQSVVFGAAMFASPEMSNEFDAGIFAGAGLAGMCALMGIGSVFYAVAGGISAAVGAFVYNLASGWVGGIEVNLERIKQKVDG